MLDDGRLVYDGDTATGIRTYHALQRAGVMAGTPAVAALSAVPVPVTLPDWPSGEVFTAVPASAHEGEGATCRKLAVCDIAGQPCQVFEMGAEALFFAEFVVHADLDVPSAGVEVLNERNIVVHGKNSIQTRAAVAHTVARGGVVRMRQRMRLGVAPGTYSFNVGLASLPVDAHALADSMPYDVLAQHIRPVVVVSGAGVFTVVPPRSGQSLPYHGLCDLDGDVSVSTENPHDA